MLLCWIDRWGRTVRCARLEARRMLLRMGAALHFGGLTIRGNCRLVGGAATRLVGVLLPFSLGNCRWRLGRRVLRLFFFCSLFLFELFWVDATGLPSRAPFGSPPLSAPPMIRGGSALGGGGLFLNKRPQAAKYQKTS